MNNIVIQKKIDELIAYRNNAIQLFEDALEAVKQANDYAMQASLNRLI